eukprot:gene11730-12950_t
MHSRNLLCFLIAIAFVNHLQSLPIEEVLSNETKIRTSLGHSSALAKLENVLGRFVKGASCTFCKIAANLIQQYFKLESTEAEIVDLLTKVCIDLKIEDTRVCTGIIVEFKGEVLDVFDMAVVTPNDICGTILGPSCADAGSAYGPWNITIPARKGRMQGEGPTRQSIRNRKATLPISKVLQISDTHVDRLYMEGANTECGEPLCCRKTDGKAPKGVIPAGKFGYYNCDTPEVTLNGLFQHIQDTHKDLDYIIWTGDVPPHNVWNQSRDDQLSTLTFAFKEFEKYFPEMKIYPCLGNHESAPVNSFPPPFVKGKESNAWLLKALADIWGKWLPEDTKPTILKGGYYTVLVRKGLRIISLNMNYCNNQNYWLLVNNADPAGQLEWMVGILEQAEKNHEKVHILGHIPPGVSDCLKHWSWNYYQVINRYSHVITAQFFGHTHHDELEIFYQDDDLKKPSSIAYIGPSVTPYTNLNPGYRIYEIDGDHPNSTAVVLDHLTYIIDLEKANKEGKAEWNLEYRATESYKMKSLLPADWDDLVETMKTDDALFKTFYSHVYKERATACDERCKNWFLCRVKCGRSASESVFCKVKDDVDLKAHRMFNFGLRKC